MDKCILILNIFVLTQNKLSFYIWIETLRMFEIIFSTSLQKLFAVFLMFDFESQWFRCLPDVSSVSNRVTSADKPINKNVLSESINK